MRTWLHILFFVLCPATGAADIRQWTDAAGRVHFGDIPPPGIDSRTIQIRPSYRSDSPGLRASEREALERIRAAEGRHRREVNAARRQSAKQRRQREAYCEESAHDLERLMRKRDAGSRRQRTVILQKRRDLRC